jgi:chromosome segregation ATPase
MSDTPMTDAQCMSGETRYTDMVHYTFAQQLERELADVNADYMCLARRLDGHDATECLLNLNRLKGELAEAREYADKLAEGLPDGMLPKDVEVLREANLGLATELTTITAQRDEARAESIRWMSIAEGRGRTDECNDPDHSAINAERAESKGLRKAWVELDDKKQDLEKQLATVTAQRDRLIKAVEPLEYWRDISECDCSSPLPQGGCLRCDLNRVLKTTNPNEP